LLYLLSYQVFLATAQRCGKLSCRCRPTQHRTPSRTTISLGTSGSWASSRFAYMGHEYHRNGVNRPSSHARRNGARSLLV